MVLPLLPQQKRQLRFLRFKRALGWAEDQQPIGIEEINGVTYLRLTRPEAPDPDRLLSKACQTPLGSMATSNRTDVHHLDRP